MTSLQADEAFVEHYQLMHDPFTPRVPGFKFFPAQRKPVLAQLHQLARYSALIQVVSGPLGSGKTLLRQALVASSNKQSVVSVPLSARQAGNSAGLLRGFSQGLGGSSQDVDGLLGQVARLNQAGQEVYLLVDDAEKLQDEALDTLAELAAGDNDGRAHVFLFAEPELLERLDALGKADGCHVQELQPYTLEDTRAYLAQRLEGAGQGLELFDDRQLEEIQVESGGWPGAINRVAREVLNEAMLAEDRSVVPAGVGMNLPKKHLLALVVVAAGVLLALVMNGKEPGRAAAVTDSLALGQQSPTAAGGNAAASTSSVVAGPLIQFEGDKPLPLPLVGQGQPVPREPLARAAGGAGVEELDASHAAMPAPVVTVDAVTAPAGGAVVGATPVVVPGGALSAAPVAQPEPTPVPTPVAEVKPAPAAPPAARPVLAPAPPSSAPATGSSNWYLSQPVGQYTLQLFGTSSEGAAQAAVREGGGDYHYFRKLHQGKPLYVVTYGHFSTPAAAKSAVSGLPARLQSGKPWPRTFASIQQEIRQAGR